MSELSKDPSPDPDVTITLRVSAWEVVMAHLGRGAFCDVATIVRSMCQQAETQIPSAQAAVSTVTPERDQHARRKLQ
jgi:hypothetical protein